MSKKPGIGVMAIQDIANIYKYSGGKHLLCETYDVTSVLQTGKSIRPLGRLLVQKLRMAVNYYEDSGYFRFKNGKLSKVKGYETSTHMASKKKFEEMRILFLAELSTHKTYEEVLKRRRVAREQRALSMSHRFKIKNRRTI